MKKTLIISLNHFRDQANFVEESMMDDSNRYRSQFFSSLSGDTCLSSSMEYEPKSLKKFWANISMHFNQKYIEHPVEIMNRFDKQHLLACQLIKKISEEPACYFQKNEDITFLNVMTIFQGMLTQCETEIEKLIQNNSQSLCQSHLRNDLEDVEQGAFSFRV